MFAFGAALLVPRHVKDSPALGVDAPERAGA
jgi:hypothetical protein